MFLDPGVTNGSMKYVRLSIDPNDPRNMTPCPNLQDEEDIRTHILPFDSNLYDSLVNLCSTENLVMDVRLASIALGMKLAKQL